MQITKNSPFIGWTQTNHDRKITSGNSHIAFHPKGKNSQGSVILLKGSIAANHTRQLGAVVNAANATLHHGGSGINKALSDATSKKHWGNEAKKYFKNTHKKKLSTASCAVLNFAPNNAGNVQTGKIIHALGPKVTKSNLKKSREKIQKTYQNIFDSCKKNNIRSVQLSPISCGKFAKKLSQSDQAKWVSFVHKTMFKEAAKSVASGNMDSVIITGSFTRC